MHMQSSVADFLTNEHQHLSSLLDIVDHLLQASADGWSLDPLRRALLWMEAFGSCHHLKEERELFPLLAQKSLPRTVSQLVAEHGMGEESLAGVHIEIDRVQGGQPDETLRLHLTAFLNGYREHIDKEDTFLIPPLGLVLEPNDEDSILAGFKELERDMLGEGEPEGLLKTLSELRVEVLGAEG